MKINKLKPGDLIVSKLPLDKGGPILVLEETEMPEGHHSMKAYKVLIKEQIHYLAVHIIEMLIEMGKVEIVKSGQQHED